ncbi:membrane-spanning 4-domains subfamily A member 15-like [Pantherophis guttatus]|uniref:Membrane-spanning 4-domains subfamily A member 15-like n=1 Tax=Pantherophis guttatus TaxID=94885 RepID=A0ABM3Z4B0_PANGU|nr:membrane-spanning 4-domains subfamily A member 15-like [Pantherophis guttatus]
MASGNTVVMPSKGANIQTPSGLPSVALQASGATPYPQLGAQQLGASTSVPQQVLQKNPLQDFLNAETKVFGAIQIMIGLLHIAFGAVVISLPPPSPGVTTVGGYPFWGGIFFISSGSLCITAANSQNRVLVKSSIGMNITSAIMALSGILICITDLAITPYVDQSSYEVYRLKGLPGDTKEAAATTSALTLAHPIPAGCWWWEQCCCWGKTVLIKGQLRASQPGHLTSASTASMACCLCSL